MMVTCGRHLVPLQTGAGELFCPVCEHDLALAREPEPNGFEPAAGYSFNPERCDKPAQYAIIVRGT